MAASTTSTAADVPVADEIVARAFAIAAGTPRPRRRSAPLTRSLLACIDRCDIRARRLSSDTQSLASAAALDFVGEAIAAVAIDGACTPGVARQVVERVASALAVGAADASFALFRRALAGVEFAQLPPGLAADFVLSLVVDLGPAVSASLWTAEEPGRTACLASAGRGAQSRTLRGAARAALDGVQPSAEHVRCQIVDRWDRQFAVLVARSQAGRESELERFLADAAAVLSPALERDALHQRGAVREREIVAAGERRLVRLGFDLHDGPLQEIVLFAQDLRVARSHIEPLLDPADRMRAGGCFDDLAARLAALDDELRQIAHSVRSTTALERPLDDALRREAAAHERASGIETKLVVTGDVATLTDSQKIVVFRVVQEALGNVRKHSSASSARVSVRSTRRLIEVTVTDDGCGFDPAARGGQSDRLGLAGVSERVRLLGGDVTIHSAPGRGTEVRATVPHWRRRDHDEADGILYAATA